MTEFKIEGPNTSVAETEEWTESPVETPAPTPLFSLKNRRTEILKNLYTDLRVPRYEDPEVWVRFKPVNTVHMNVVLKKRQASKDPDWGLKANADVLINSCIGVYAMFPENPDEKYSLTEGNPLGEWTKFDTKLAQALEIPVPDSDQAASIVRSFYFADGDLIDTTDRLMKFSNISNTEADTVF
jgi:hypothetical protein